MKLLLCPDKYKGSLDSEQLGAALAEGARLALPEAAVVSLPLADGGDGTEAVLRRQLGGTEQSVRVADPLGRPVQAGYTLLGEGHTAVIEMARASGLALLAPSARDALRADTYGTGELMRHALAQGARRLLLCIGGSATTDGGAGMARALGYRLLDAEGEDLPPGGAALARLERIAAPQPDPLAGIEVEVACDVDNPLLGPRGAARVYAPQKGASEAEVAQLERGLERLAQVWAEMGHAVAERPGAGAAGGLGAGLIAFARARLRSGIELVMHELDFEAQVRQADLILTGEGRLDGQTFSGKVIHGVCQVARRHGVPVAALCGAIDLSPDQQQEMGLSLALSVLPAPCSLEQAMHQARPWVVQSAFSVVKLFYEARVG